MTPKYSAQWWEKVAARPQQSPPEHDAPPTACSMDAREVPETAVEKTKPRKSFCRQTS
jgi:hypothetical protein